MEHGDMMYLSAHSYTKEGVCVLNRLVCVSVPSTLN